MPIVLGSYLTAHPCLDQHIVESTLDLLRLLNLLHIEGEAEGIIELCHDPFPLSPLRKLFTLPLLHEHAARLNVLLLLLAVANLA